jgi:hypothetical protein
MSNQIVPISQIAGLNDGDAISAISGVIETVYKRTTGTSKNGKPYSFQNLILKDQTGQIRVTLAFRKECPDSLKGKQVVISSLKGDRGWDGVFAKDNTYKGNTTREVQVTDVATVKLVEQQPSLVSSATQNGAPTAHVVHGATVGMAVNNANLVILSQSPKMEYFISKEYAEDLVVIAGTNLRVSHALEYGKPLDDGSGKKAEQAPAASPAPAAADEDGDNFLKDGDVL